MFTPAADIEVDEPLVRVLLDQQHPDLAHHTLRLVANGWDNAIYRLGDELVVRLPRRQVAVTLIENENTWLPRIAGRLRTAVPVPLRIGTPSERFPWPWSISRWIDGQLVAETPFDEHDGLAAQLADFLVDLHVAAPSDAPVNPVRGVPLELRDAALTARLQTGLVPRADDVARAWEVALTASKWSRRPLWLHGDLHPANILTRDGGLAGVIDFGDLTAGDPATDLATAWLTFDRTGRRAFVDRLDYDDETWRRARGWALVMSTALLANSADAPTMRRIGLHSLAQVLDDE